MKDSELIFGLMASFSKQAYSFDDLIHLTSPFHVSIPSLRTNLSRMSAANTITAVKKGKKAYYSFTNTGRRISENVSLGFHTPDWNGWNGEYWGVVFSVPQEHSEYRHTIRKILSKYRFACLNAGFWIRPINPQERIPERLESILSSGYCRLIKFHNQTEFTVEQAAALWNTEEINRDFIAGLQLLQTKLKSLYTLSAKQALVEKMTTGDTIVNILFSDPLLPRSFYLIPGRETHYAKALLTLII